MQIFAYPHGFPRQIRPPEIYLQELIKMRKANDECGFDGILFFTSLGDSYDQWTLGAVVAEESRQIPLFAVLPHWEHPIITARKIVTYQKLYKRPVAINWITGLALRDQEKLGSKLSKEERYALLGEYIEIVTTLLNNQPLHFEGKYFQINDHKLGLLPDYPVFQFISGASEPCEKILQKFSFLKQIAMGMAPGFTYGPRVKGLGFGMITRPTEEEALAVFRKTFPIDSKGEIYVKLAKNNTDSTWKQHLFDDMNNHDGQNGFFSSALKGYSELGFFVGSYDRAAAYIRELKGKGVDTLLVSQPDSSDSHHLHQAIKRV